MPHDDQRISGLIERGAAFTISVDGETLPAYEGETVATVLMAAGRRMLRRTPNQGQPRGVYCGMGVCHDCLMVVDGQPNIRACMTAARPGMRVETQQGLGTWGNET